jgi:hypothetical protein
MVDRWSCHLKCLAITGKTTKVHKDLRDDVHDFYRLETFLTFSMDGARISNESNTTSIEKSPPLDRQYANDSVTARIVAGPWLSIIPRASHDRLAPRLGHSMGTRASSGLSHSLLRHPPRYRTSRVGSLPSLPEISKPSFQSCSTEKVLTAVLYTPKPSCHARATRWPRKVPSSQAMAESQVIVEESL